MFDIAELKRTYPLLDVVRQRVELKKSGRWWIGPCPFCGGTDRFNLRDDRDGDGYVWLCRHCTDGKYRTAVDYVMRAEGVDVKQALEIMARETGARPLAAAAAPSAARPAPPSLPPSAAPAADWQETARQIIAQGMANLWEAQGQRAREWLFARGLTEDDLLMWSLGYSRGQEIAGVWVERGILIPCVEPDASGAERVWYIQVRRPAGQPKYRKIRGSGTGLFGAWTLAQSSLALIVEGEFDAMVLWRALRRLQVPLTVGVATAGSATSPVNLLDWAHVLAHQHMILAAYDNDRAGAGGLERWRRLTRRAYRAPLPKTVNGKAVKDVTDYLLAGGDLAAWAQAQIEQHLQPEPML